MKLEYPQYENGMYKLDKADFDDIAYEILDEYLPDALNSPRVVDINYLIKDCLYLNVFSKNITVDKSVLGLIAFENATLPCYNLAFNRTQMELQAGDIVIDLSLSGKQMKLRRRFTLAHEAAHWILHRSYHSPVNQQFEFRKPYEETLASNLEMRFQRIFTDSDREEWQANSLAAAILMPENVFRDAAFDSKLASHVTKGKITFVDSEDYKEFLNYLSDIFEVSRQAAEIRLEQLGIIDFRE